MPLKVDPMAKKVLSWSKIGGKCIFIRLGGAVAQWPMALPWRGRDKLPEQIKITEVANMDSLLVLRT